MKLQCGGAEAGKDAALAGGISVGSGAAETGELAGSCMCEAYSRGAVCLGSGAGEDMVDARRAAGTNWGENRARGGEVRRKREAREAGYRDTSQWGQTTSSHKGARDRARREALGKGRASRIHNEGEVKNDDNEAE